MSTLARQNTTAGGSAGDQEVAAMRDEVVTMIWTNTLPAYFEQKLKEEPTSTGGTFYSDLTSLHNQYMTALTVLAKAGYTRSDNASELSDADKLQAIEIAKTLLTASDDA